jgi:hypothetical protein
MDMSHKPYTLGTLLLGEESLVLEAWWGVKVGMDNLKKKFCVHFLIPAYVLYTLPISSTVKKVVSHARLTDVDHLK